MKRYKITFNKNDEIQHEVLYGTSIEQIYDIYQSEGIEVLDVEVLEDLEVW